MVYEIEFIRLTDGKPEALTLDAVRLVGDTLLSVISRAEELYRKPELLPLPDGFRIRKADGEVVFEFLDPT